MNFYQRESEPDWNREQCRRFWDPSRKLLKAIRDYQKLDDRQDLFACVLRKSCVIRHRFWSVVTASDIPLNCKLGGGLLIPHPNGIVIHPGASVGINCLILQQVTLCDKVRVANQVDFGAGAKVVKSVCIGSHAVIGANAVVLQDIPADATAVGVPARIIKKSYSSEPTLLTTLDTVLER